MNKPQSHRRDSERSDPKTWLLVPSMLLGPETWRGVAEVLHSLFQVPVIASPRVSTPKVEDHIGPWVQDVVGAMPEPPSDESGQVVVAGHSASCPRLPLVADELLSLGYDVAAVVSVNGRVPHDQMAPVCAEQNNLKELLDGLTRPDGYLPPWHRWWGSMIESTIPDQATRDRIFDEVKPVPRAMFDQPIPAPKLPGDVGRAYLALGEFYVPSMEEARMDGWEVAKIEGEHLQLAVDPTLVACMLMSLAAKSQTVR